LNKTVRKTFQFKQMLWTETSDQKTLC